MVIKAYVIFLLLIILYSCSIEQETASIEFPKTIKLFAKEIIIEDIYMKYPYRIRYNNPYLYVMDLHPTGYYCHQIDYTSMKYKYSQGFAKRGEAPNEFLDAENIRIDKNSDPWILDANKMQIAGFSHGQLDNPYSIINLDKKLIRSLDFDILDDSIFIVPDYIGESRLCFINRKGEIVKKSFTIPIQKREKHFPTIVIAQAWRSFLSYNPKLGILAMATQLGQVVEIYDIKNDSVIKIIHNKHLEPQFMAKGNYAIPIGIMGYSDIYVGNKNIYAIFWGHSFNDIKNGKIEKEGGCYIHVFDLHGNPIVKYELDRHITGFYIDENNKTIIALDVNSNQPIIEYSY